MERIRVAAMRLPRSDGLSRVRALATATPAVPVLIAIVLGLYRAADKSIWLDEAVSVAIARLPTRQMLEYLLHVEMHAAPYYVALHMWTFLGTTEGVVRALSIVFGVIAVLATWAIGRRYRVAFPAALILSLTTVFVEFEQEARGYTLLMAGSAVATLLFLRLLERRTRLRAALYVAAAGALIYIHPIGAFVVVAHVLAVILFRPRDEWLRVLALFAPVGVLWVPMILFAVRNHDRIAWIQPITIDSTVQTLIALGGGLAAAAVLAVLLVLGVRRDVVTLWLIIPILGTIALSLFVQPTLQMRYLLGVVPAAAVIAARNRALFIGLLLAVSIAGTWSWYTAGVKDDWRDAAAWTAARVEPGDGIVFNAHYLRIPFGYYARVGEPLWRPVPWTDSDLADAPTDPAAFDGVNRIWLVEGTTTDAPAEISAALEAFTPAGDTSFEVASGTRVTLLVRRAGEAP